MDVYPKSQVPARWDVACSVDLTNATAQVEIGGVWYNANWTGPAVMVDGVSTRTLRLAIGGVDATQSEVDALLLEDEEPRVLVKIGTTVLVGASSERLVTRE